ncbi:tyrosine-type recombinase/integrase [Salinirubellus sp. GCM10025818]|uniref:tyrosine-type recombinase/integrase n=1 Tax=Salinirubellus TaxID=2162630 RepID=UPI0030D17F4F
MSDSNPSDPEQEGDSLHAAKEALASKFGRTLDPLAEYEPIFREEDPDLFGMFMTEIVEPNDPAPSTTSQYGQMWEQWCEVMGRDDRHPACPNEQHALAYIQYLQDERENEPGTIRAKLQKMGRIYEHWQDEAALPHPDDFDPISSARKKVSLSDPQKKSPPNIPLERLREVVGGIHHIRDQAVVVMQLKLGLRATELCNIKLTEISLVDEKIRAFYPELGTSEYLEGRENAIYIPHDRMGNKSKRPRVLPLDEELRQVLRRYLLIRPASNRPWLFLSKQRHARLGDSAINDVWHGHFRPEYDETPQHRAVTSHFGRHYFTTWWRVKQNLNRELVKYMRGDKQGMESGVGREGMDHYLHAYYEDIESIYLNRVFKLNL